MRLLLIYSLLIVAICTFSCNKQQKNNEISTKNIESAEELIGLNFTPDERDSMLSGIQDVVKDYEKIRNYPVSNNIPPALLFNPMPTGFRFPIWAEFWVLGRFREGCAPTPVASPWLARPGRHFMPGIRRPWWAIVQLLLLRFYLLKLILLIND